MAESITQRLGAAPIDKMSEREVRALLNAVLVDLTALKAQLAQLITDYNANETIATDTTAVAPTLTLTA
jgi:hypothetical protein